MCGADIYLFIWVSSSYIIISVISDTPAEVFNFAQFFLDDGHWCAPASCYIVFENGPGKHLDWASGRSTLHILQRKWLRSLSVQPMMRRCQSQTQQSAGPLLELPFRALRDRIPVSPFALPTTGSFELELPHRECIFVPLRTTTRPTPQGFRAHNLL